MANALFTVPSPSVVSGADSITLDDDVIGLVIEFVVFVVALEITEGVVAVIIVLTIEETVDEAWGNDTFGFMGGITVTAGAAATATAGVAVTATGGAAVTATGGAAVTDTGGAAVTDTGGAAVTDTGGAAVTDTGGETVTGGFTLSGGVEFDSSSGNSSRSNLFM